MCLAQGHNTVTPVRLKPAAPQSLVKHSTTKPLLEFGLVVQEMSFEDISYLELKRPFCSAGRNHLCDFGRRYYVEQFCKSFLNLDQ